MVEFIHAVKLCGKIHPSSFMISASLPIKMNLLPDFRKIRLGILCADGSRKIGTKKSVYACALSVSPVLPTVVYFSFSFSLADNYRVPCQLSSVFSQIFVHDPHPHKRKKERSGSLGIGGEPDISPLTSLWLDA